MDIIEAGFPISSDGDFEAVKAVGRDPHRSSWRAWPGRCRRHRPGLGGAQGARPARIHVFLATSDLHLEYKLRIDRDDLPRRGRARRSATPASADDDVEFSAGGRHPQRPRVPVPGRGGGGRGRRHHDQHARHRRLRHAGRHHGGCSAPSSASATKSSCRRTATTTSAWPWPTRWPRSRPARGRSSAPSTASASGPATPRSKRS